MQEILEGWMFQPGKVRGVRWTIHEVEEGNGLSEALVLTNPVFQLLAGTRMRSAAVIQMKSGVRSDFLRNQHATGFFYVASGIIQAYTANHMFADVDEPALGELQVLYPAHGVVVPAGVVYGINCLADATLVYVCDEEEQSEPVRVARWPDGS